MATNVLLLHYNNYYNRIVKKLATVAEYKEADANYKDCTNINFVPGDCVKTSLVLGFGTNPADLSNNFDYLVVYDSTNSTILSRWFITENVRTREGQWEFSLKRDTIADNYDAVMGSTCFIEKGYVDEDDSAIFNKEDMTFNEIKDGEFLLKDETQCPWIVGYVAKDRSQNGVIQDTTFTDANLVNIEASAGAATETYDTFDEFYAAHTDIMGEFGVVNYAQYSVQLDVCYANLFSTFDVGITCTIDQNGRVTWKESGYNNNQYLHGLDSAVGY